MASFLLDYEWWQHEVTAISILVKLYFSLYKFVQNTSQMERSVTSEQTVTQIQTETVLETDITDSASQVCLVLLWIPTSLFQPDNEFNVIGIVWI